MELAKIKKVTLFFCLGLILLSTPATAQYFAVGQDPSNIKWREINTSNFQIIYPSDYESEAQRVARIFEKVYDYSGVTLKHKPKKISVILHTKTINSNGFVAWSPSRVELFPTPNQEIYAQEWMEQLAIHELRHHVQIDKIEDEMPKIFRILLGEQAASVVIGAYLPFWFLEGDAVVTETALSHSGRGRIPSFTMELKAQADEKGIYSLDKAYLGSYKDFIPDYYQLGYQLVSNIRNQNGGEVWSKVLHHIARNPLAMNSLSKGLILATGQNQDEHYLEIMCNLKHSHPFRFNNQEDTVLLGHKISSASSVFCSYKYPSYVNDSSYVALKTSLNQLPAIVLIEHNGSEKILFTPGTVLEESMSFKNGKVIWIESHPDPRWTHRERSLMRIFDINNEALQEKIFEEKIFAPEFSADGKWIAAVKFDENNSSSIVLIDTNNKQIMKEFKAKNHQTYLTPSWSVDQNCIYAVKVCEEGKKIISINLQNEEEKDLTGPVYGEYKKPIQQGDNLYFISDLSGKDQGYAMDLTTKKSYLVLTTKYGIRDLRISQPGTNLLYADYSANGFKISQKSVSRPDWRLIDTIRWFHDTLATHLTNQDSGIVDFSKLDTARLKSSRYSKIGNLINIHSWSPVYIDADQSVVNTGFSVVSQNKLTTAITQFGYDYSTINHTGKWIGKFEYAGWYPVIRLYGDYGKEYSTYYQINRHYNSHNVLTGQDTIAVKYSQKVLNTHLDAMIPMNFSHGKMFRMVEPEVQIGYSHHWQEPTTPSLIFRGSYIPFTFRLYAHNLIQQSVRDIQPRWGEILDFQYRCTPIGDRQLGRIASGEGTFYLPGLIANQGIKLYFGYQKKESDHSYFNDLIYYARGYSTLENNELFTLRSDYVFSLLMPDWNIWHLYYLKRVTMRIHYDFSRIAIPLYPNLSVLHKNLSSTGAELLTECNFLRFLAPVKLGLRESYLIQSSSIRSEFIISVNFGGL